MSKTILVVEDNADFRETVVELLQRAGYKTLEAAQGKEAIAVLSKQEVHLVLSDIKMPVLDGFALLNHIQTLEENRPKVVMMTGYSVYTKDQAIKAGAETLVEKSKLDTLIKILSSIRFY